MIVLITCSNKTRKLLKQISSTISECEEIKQDGLCFLKYNDDKDCFYIYIYSANEESLTSLSDNDKSDMGFDFLYIFDWLLQSSLYSNRALKNYMGKYDENKPAGHYQEPKTNNDRMATSDCVLRSHLVKKFIDIGEQNQIQMSSDDRSGDDVS